MDAKLMSIVIAIVAGCVWPVHAQPTTQPAPVAERPTTAVDAVLQAADPSAAVAAYVSGVAIEKDSPRLLDAFVRRMVQFGVPEMVFHQAQTLTGQDPNHGLSWAVIAYVDAKQGKLLDAITAIGSAAEHSPADAFVQATAGQLVAWADSNPQPPLPDPAKTAVQKVRQAVGTRVAFVGAYNQARDALQAEAAQQAPAPGAGPIPPPAGPIAPGGANLPYPYYLPAGPPWFYDDSYYYPPTGFIYGGYLFYPRHHRFDGRNDADGRHDRGWWSSSHDHSILPRAGRPATSAGNPSGAVTPPPAAKGPAHFR